MTSETGKAAGAAVTKTRLPRDVRQAAMVVILGAFMTFLDSTIVNVALNKLSTSFGSPLADVQWVVTGYLLSMAAVIPLTGWAARRIGTRRLYMIALGVFTLASVLCGLSTSLPELIIFRVAQGIGGGLVLPVGQIAILKKAGRQNVPRVMAAIGITMVLAPIFGPTVGGLLIDYASWHWIFFVNLPIGLAALVLAPRHLPRDEAEVAGPLDGTGLVVIAAGLVGITYGLAEIGASASLAQIYVPLAAGVVLAAVFVMRTLRVSHPLLDLRMYRNTAFSAASAATFCVSGVLYGGMVLMPLYFQIVRHDSVVVTGLLIAPTGIGAAIANWIGGRTVERLGGGQTAVLGGVVSVVATLPFVFLGAATPYAWLGVAMLIRGFGVGMSMMPVLTTAYRLLPPQQISHATPQISVLQRVGGSLGTAILIVVLQLGLNHSGGQAPAQAASFNTAFWWVFAIAALAMAPIALLRMCERRRAAQQVTPEPATAKA